jgi:hypothetical protein
MITGADAITASALRVGKERTASRYPSTDGAGLWSGSALEKVAVRTDIRTAGTMRAAHQSNTYASRLAAGLLLVDPNASAAMPSRVLIRRRFSIRSASRTDSERAQPFRKGSFKKMLPSAGPGRLGSPKLPAIRQMPCCRRQLVLPAMSPDNCAVPENAAVRRIDMCRTGRDPNGRAAVGVSGIIIYQPFLPAIIKLLKRLAFWLNIPIGMW